MPIDYKKYPSNWKHIRERILKRAENKCECCGVENYKYIFRGVLQGKEVYQDNEANIYDASNSNFLLQDYYAMIEPLSKKQNQRAIKVVLTISHLDHDEENHNVTDDRLKAMCQLCHLRYDAKEKSKRKLNKKMEDKNCKKGKAYCSQSSEICGCWEKQKKETTNKIEFEKPILWIESKYNELAYLQGQNAKEKDTNPFEKNTNSWYNWNKGKNEKLINETTR